jgi:two-component system, OmpR family, sensor histidine kinase KdpD
MNFAVKHLKALMRLGKIIVFIAAVLGATKLTLELGPIANASTAAFSFLIIVLLSAVFGDFLVAFFTSIAASLCFDYYFLPPFGTFYIASFSDWISLAAFLSTSVIISHLTASAVDNKTRTNILNKSLEQLKEFGERLLSMQNDDLTLSEIAKEALSVFSLEYCSIHVYGDGKWRHFTGSAASNVSQEVENYLKVFKDHPIDVMDLVEENMLGVRYSRISKGKEAFALLAVKSKTLPTEVIGTIASIISVRLK